MWQDDAKLAVIWSSGDVPRGIRVASLSLPPAGKKVVSIRNNSYFQHARPELLQGKWLRFYGQERLQTAAPIKLQPSSTWDARVASAGGWLRLKHRMVNTGETGLLNNTSTGGFPNTV